MLKDEAIQFYTQLVGGQVPWRRSADGDRSPSEKEKTCEGTTVPQSISGDGHTDLNTLPPRLEGGCLPSRPEEGNLNQDQEEEEEVEEDTYFSPREPSPGQDSSEKEQRRHRYGRHRSRVTRGTT